MGKPLKRKAVEVTCDLSPSMMLIAAEVFYNANVVNDRFHVRQVYNEAVDEIRIDIRSNSSPKRTPGINHSRPSHIPTGKPCVRYRPGASTR